MRAVEILMDTFCAVILLDSMSIFRLHMHINAVKAEESYFISDSYSSWTEKDTVCTIAVPSIKYDPEGISVEMEETLAIGKDDVWVGYSETLTAFDYIACLNPTSLQRADMIKSELGNVGSPGQCFSACAGGNVIGISQQQCICFNESQIENMGIQNTLAQCESKCVYQPGIACGGLTYNGDRLISVFRYNPDAKSVEDGDMDMFCLRLDPLQRQFSWFNCSLIQQNICDFSAVKEETYLPESSTEMFYSWMENANKCMKYGGFPLPFQNYSAVSLNVLSEVWTNVIRSPVIRSVEYEGKHQDPAPRAGVRYGFVQMQNGTYWLKFTNGFTTNKRILCQQVETSGSGLNSDVSVVVGVPIAVVSVILVVVIILVVPKRRNKIAECCNTTSKTEGPENLDGFARDQTVAGEISNMNSDYYELVDISHENRAEGNNSGQTQDNHTYTCIVSETRENE